MKRLTQSKPPNIQERIHYAIDEEREIAQVEVMKAAYNGQTEGGFYDQGGQAPTTEEAADRTLSPGRIILSSFPYRGE